jgi:hypothetical protein
MIMNQIAWKKTPDGEIAVIGNHNLRVGDKLSNDTYPYFVHKDGDSHQIRGEERTIEKAKEVAISLACTE